MVQTRLIWGYMVFFFVSMGSLVAVHKAAYEHTIKLQAHEWNELGKRHMGGINKLPPAC